MLLKVMTRRSWVRLIAERIRRLVVQRKFEVIMTRTTDETLSLRQRAAIANGQRGDIFVSIHLNSFQPSNECDVETYYLRPSHDLQRDALAAKENEQSGYALSDMRSLFERIYTDARRDESRRLAEAVQRTLMRTLRTADPALTDRGVKMAPFVVLVATNMPAILAEVSCLSNAVEAQRLRAALHREMLAEAVVSGIEAFARPTGPKTAMSRSLLKSAAARLTRAWVYHAKTWYLLMLRMDDMNAGLPRREPLNVTAEPGRDLLETDIFDVTKSVRAKNRCNASRLETAGPTFLSFLKLFGPLRYHSPHLS